MRLERARRELLDREKEKSKERRLIKFIERIMRKKAEPEKGHGKRGNMSVKEKRLRGKSESEKECERQRCVEGTEKGMEEREEKV